jgi:sulfofructose kinase
MSIRALCVGHASYDLCMVTEDFPAENSKTETKLLIESSGGPAANAAVLLAQWGVPVAMAGQVGDDDYGRRVVDDLHQAGVDCRWLKKVPEQTTPVSFVVVNRANGSRTIINRKDLPTPLNLRPHDFSGLSPDLLLLDGHELPASLAALEAFPDAATILDAGSLREGTRVLAERVQYLVCSERFAAQFLDKTVRGHWQEAVGQLRKLNRQVAVITLGNQGLVYDDRSETGHIAALKCEAKDTTAAGDIFHGALAFGLLQKMALRQALELATVAAGLSVQKFGGRPSIPDLQSVKTHLGDGH